MLGNTTSSGIPDLIFQVQCNQKEHKVTTDMTKGFFIIKDNEFISKIVLQVIDLSEERITHKGCGYPWCVSTLEGALWQFSGPILCYQCRTNHNIVDMTQGCDQHTDTKLTTLIFNRLGFVAQHYYREDKTLMGKSITLPHTLTLLTVPTKPPLPH